MWYFVDCQYESDAYIYSYTHTRASANQTAECMFNRKKIYPMEWEWRENIPAAQM